MTLTLAPSDRAGAPRATTGLREGVAFRIRPVIDLHHVTVLEAEQDLDLLDESSSASR